MQQERRKSQRHPIHFQLEIIGTDPDGYRFTEWGRLIDISGSGAKFHSGYRNRYQEGQVVKTRILLPDRTGLSGSMAASARVIRLEEKKQSLIQVAVQFVERLNFKRERENRCPVSSRDNDATGNNQGQNR